MKLPTQYSLHPVTLLPCWLVCPYMFEFYFPIFFHVVGTPKNSFLSTYWWPIDGFLNRLSQNKITHPYSSIVGKSHLRFIKAYVLNDTSSRISLMNCSISPMSSSTWVPIDALPFFSVFVETYKGPIESKGAFFI